MGDKALALQEKRKQSQNSWMDAGDTFSQASGRPEGSISRFLFFGVSVVKPVELWMGGWINGWEIGP